MIPAAFQILLASDDPKLSDALSGALSSDAVVLWFTSKADEAMQILQSRPADLVLVDLGSLETEGFELLRQLKENPPARFTLVFAFTAASDTAKKLRAYELGATDCINRSFEPAVLRARLQAALAAKGKIDESFERQRELSEACLTAEAAARAKSDFLAAMSHEIRTPMNGVIAMVSLLLETQMTVEQRGYLETVHTSSESLL